jgi:hypothetical protein
VIVGGPRGSGTFNVGNRYLAKAKVVNTGAYD